MMPMKTSTTTHEGRVALVTGAAQGIGQAIAVALAERGAQVIATDLTRPHETVEKIGPTAHAFQLDVTQEEDWRSVSVKSRDVGDVDIVVNNAGYFPNRSIDELDLPTWRKTMATNLDAQFLSAKYFLPAMRRNKWARFVGISSNMVGLAIPTPYGPETGSREVKIAVRDRVRRSELGTRASSEGWRVQWERDPPGEKSETP